MKHNNVQHYKTQGGHTKGKNTQSHINDSGYFRTQDHELTADHNHRL